MIVCAQVQAALSARLDGESAGVADDVVDAHLSGCAECQAFFDQAARLNRQLRFNAASADPSLAVPDLSEEILAGLEPVRRRRALGLIFARISLVLLGLMYCGWAMQLLGQSTQAQLAVGSQGLVSALIDAAAVRFALGCGLFFAAWRPQLSVALMPVYGAFAAFSCGFATRAVVLGQASAQDVFDLMVLVASALVLLWAWLSGFGSAIFGRVWRNVTAQPY